MIDAVAGCACISDYLYDQEDRSDEEAEPTFSEDEAVTQKGLRRSQSVKMTRARVRRDVSHHRASAHPFLPVHLYLNHPSPALLRPGQARYGSLKIKGKKRPALSSVNYGT